MNRLASKNTQITFAPVLFTRLSSLMEGEQDNAISPDRLGEMTLQSCYPVIAAKIRKILSRVITVRLATLVRAQSSRSLWRPEMIGDDSSGRLILPAPACIMDEVLPERGDVLVPSMSKQMAPLASFSRPCARRSIYQEQKGPFNEETKSFPAVIIFGGRRICACAR